MSAEDLTTAELVDELTRRQVLPPCICGKWSTYIGAYDRDGVTLRCHMLKRLDELERRVAALEGISASTDRRETP